MRLILDFYQTNEALKTLYSKCRRLTGGNGDLGKGSMSITRNQADTIKYHI